MKNAFVDSAIKFLKKTKGTEVAFSQIWNDYLPKDIKGSESERLLMAEAHAELMQDARFVNVGKNMWKLRDFVNLHDFKTNKTSMFGIEATKEALKPKNGKEKDYEVVTESVTDELNLEMVDEE